MVRRLLQSLVMLAAGITVNATMHLLNLLLLRSVWPYDVSLSLYAFLATPVIPLYGLISHAPSWYAPAPQGGLVLRLIILNSLIWGMVTAASWAALHHVVPGAGTRLAPCAILIVALGLTILSLTPSNPPHALPVGVPTAGCAPAFLSSSCGMTEPARRSAGGVTWGPRIWSMPVRVG